VSFDKYHHITDAELLQRYLRTDDAEWLGILLQRYTLLLLGVCMKYLKNETEARDSVQQIFLKVIQEVKKYKIDYFKSWLYMVAKNHCLTVLRDKKGKIPEDLLSNENTIAQDANNVEPDNEQSIYYLSEALEGLNVEQKQCVTLFYLQKKSYQEISNLTHYSLLQVKSYIQNGKRNLKLSIEKKINQANHKNV
jgi:RNA polymerase sigma factor (sigma-70 family)